MDVLCTDKTGTLTQDKIILERHVDVFGENSEEVLKHAYLNSYYQTGLKNLLDVAVLKHAEIVDELKLTWQLPASRRDPVRFFASPDVGGGARASKTTTC